MTITEIAEKLEAAGCQIAVRGERVYVNKTPNGTASGYCVEADDVRDITENISKRQGDVRNILRA